MASQVCLLKCTHVGWVLGGEDMAREHGGADACVKKKLAQP